MHLWIWRNFRIKLPEDWEMLQFSRDSAGGKCAFADRYQIRLEFDWRMVGGTPDFDRMMSDYASKLEHEDKLTDIAHARVAGWRGVLGRREGTHESRFGRHFAGESCLVELVFIWPGEKDSGLERTIVRSVRPEPERLGRFRRWRAFGMDLLASKELDLQDCTVEPANVVMSFANDAKPPRLESFGRLGMVSEWMRGTVGDWLLRRTPGEIEPGPLRPAEVNGHNIEHVSGRSRPGFLASFFQKCRSYEAAAWICPADGRLYFTSVDCPDPDGAAGPEFAGGRLSCCRDMELSL